MIQNLISIIIPTYNRAMTIKRAIDSVIVQDYSPIEILVVDDCSSDNTETLVKSYPKEKNIHYLYQSKRYGAQAARIRGIKEAQGEFLVFLDSDDILLPGSISKRVTLFKSKNITNALIYGDLLLNSQYIAFDHKAGYVYPELLKELSLCPYSVIMLTAKCFQNNNYLSEDFPACQDDDFVLGIAKDFPIYHLPEPIAEMYLSERSITRDQIAVYEGMKKLIKKYQTDIKKYHGYSCILFWNLRLLRKKIQIKIKTLENQKNSFLICKRKFYSILIRILHFILALYFKHLYF